MQVAFDTSVGGKCAQQAQYWLRKSATLFTAGADMFPGDEDNGSMGAWYIFNAIGLYPISPASGKFILGSPLFGSVSIDVGAAQPLVISTVNQGPNNVYVTGATWNGAAVDGVFVAYSDLMQGGTLEFTLAAAPTAAGAAAMPPFA
jgi:putative alpha-1,2-mannosidase